MSSYHTSFSYKDKNSADEGLIIVSFEPDDGFKDTFLSMDNISDDYYDGTKRFDYGSKYNSSAEVQITAIKKNGADMTVNEFRSYAKWLTGARINSWLDMYAGDTIVYSFLGKFLNMEQYKLDGRTIGFRLTFSSVSPWAYSAPQVFNCILSPPLNIINDGVLNKGEDNTTPLGIYNGVLCGSSLDQNNYFNITDDGIVYLDNAYRTIIDNKSDDLYTYTYLDIDYKNKNSNYFSVKNATLDEEALVTNISINESISISAKQFIISDIPNKIFGDSFNFVWPRLQPGLNDFIIDGDYKGSAQFTYRYPMKIGDCAMDISVYGGNTDCGEMAPYNTVKWENIVGAPTSLGGYGITDAYTTTEVDSKLDNIENEINNIKNDDIEWNEIINTPTTIDGYGITDVYTTDDVYTKTEVDDKIEDIEISGGSGSTDMNIDETELDNMLDSILG